MDLTAFDLKGKVALVTGGAHGIGFSIAEGMAKCGATVCFNCSNEGSLEKGLAAYKAAGIDAHGYVADVTDEAAVNAMIAQIKAEVGPVDILVNNAGLMKRVPMIEMSHTDFLRVIDVHVGGAFNCSKAVLPDMIAKREGKIINICSMMSELGRETVSAYAAAKGAVTEYDITAEDFVFAFRRIFRADTASPYAVEFSAIQNSAAVLSGLADESSLGVSANGPLTLVFRLSERDDNFLAKLAMPGAAPCDEAFFESTRGTYGLTAKTTLASGSFYLYNWTANGLFLRRTVESPLVGSLRLVQDTSGSGKSAAQLIADDKCSAALDESGETTSLQTVSYSDTTWALLFNAAEGSVFQNQQLRQALAGIARENADVPSSGLYAAAKGLVPEGLTVDGLDYRETAGNPLPTIPEPKALYLAARQGMATSDFSGVTLLLPKNAGLGELADQINSAWQKECSLFFSVEEVEQDEFDARIAAGKYTIALAPIRAEGGSVYQMLQQFTAEGGSLTGYADTVYADRLALSAQQTGKDRCALLAQCERQLLESCTVVPLMAQQKRLLLANGVRDLVFDPFFPVLDLTWAKMS